MWAYMSECQSTSTAGVVKIKHAYENKKVHQVCCGMSSAKQSQEQIHKSQDHQAA